MFMSVDVIDSTPLKHPVELRNLGDTQKVKDAIIAKYVWVKALRSFYADFSEQFRIQYAVADNEIRLACPRFWKARGDELIFAVELKQESDARTHLARFVKTIEWYHAKQPSFGRTATGSPIKLKATAWLAGFPLRNYILDVQDLVFNRPSSDSTNLESETRDFIGPSVDLGFRLEALATYRKLIVSADLAWLVTRKQNRKTLSESRLKLRYDGRAHLKGVFGGVAYPVFWFDLGDEVDEVEDDALGKTQSFTHLKTLLNELIRANLPEIPRPFIAKADGKLGHVPPELSQAIDEIKKVEADLTPPDEDSASEATDQNEPVGNKGAVEQVIDDVLPEPKSNEPLNPDPRP
jgi:hypothetical protein